MVDKDITIKSGNLPYRSYLRAIYEALGYDHFCAVVNEVDTNQERYTSFNKVTLHRGIPPETIPEIPPGDYFW